MEPREKFEEEKGRKRPELVCVGNFLRLEVGVRTRWCNECGRALTKGEPHIRAYVGSLQDNCCVECFDSIIQRLKEAWESWRVEKRRSG